MTPPALRLTLVASAVFSGLLGAHRAAPPRVTIDTGTLEGVVDSASGVMVFRGIPYAAPPVGALRWRPPQPATHWTGVRPASQLGHNCIQHQPYGDIDPFAAGVSEDCLYLNVWTSSLPLPASRVPRPVMVWIHGGGFFAGFGGEERHNGAPLAQKGAVVVTLNYRLGPFGFLAHPALAAESPHHAAGNYGLLDQIAALQWVQRNIARFGGDPSRVTIFGESAGGFSVGSLIASPLAKGLFQRAILESGTGIGAGISSRDDARAVALRFADSLHVYGIGPDAIAHLRALSPDTVLAASLHLGPPGAPAFYPVVDGWVLPHAVDSALCERQGEYRSRHRRHESRRGRRVDGRADAHLRAPRVRAWSADVRVHVLARRRRQREPRARRVPQRGNHLRLRTTASAAAECGLDGLRLDGG